MKKGTTVCHPDRPHKAHGLCKSCYDKLPARLARIKSYTNKHARRDQLKCLYGLTVEDYDAFVQAQNGLCAICGLPPRGKMKRLSVDHDHKTGTVRGLLCITCNRTLGYLDNENWRTKAEAYLSKYSGDQRWAMANPTRQSRQSKT